MGRQVRWPVNLPKADTRTNHGWQAQRGSLMGNTAEFPRQSVAGHQGPGREIHPTVVCISLCSPSLLPSPSPCLCLPMLSSISFCHSGPFPLFSFCYSDLCDSLGQEFGIWEGWYTKGLGNRFVIHKGEKGVLSSLFVSLFVNLL